jgi:hypothetical protein
MCPSGTHRNGRAFSGRTARGGGLPKWNQSLQFQVWLLGRAVFRYIDNLDEIGMGAVYFVIEHPLACVGMILVILFAWSTFGVRDENQQKWDARRILRTFSPSAVVILLVIAASVGLKQNLPRIDFGMFYSSAFLLQQDPQHLYDPQKQTEYLHAVTGLKGERHYLPFAYPPFVAFLFTPMTAFSFRNAYLLMLAINISILALTFWVLASRLKFGQDQATAFFISSSGALPLYAALILGHLTFLGMLLLALFVTDLFGDRKPRSGLWVGFMLFKPILFPVPLLMLVLTRQWRAIVVFVCTASALLGLSLALVGRNGLWSNIAMMRVMTNDYLLPRTHSLRGLAFFIHFGFVGWIALALVVVVALGIAAFHTRDQHWLAAGMIMAIMLVSPYLQYHDLAIGLVGIALAIATMRPIIDKTRIYLFLIALVPAGVVLTAPKSQPIFPVMPVLLTVSFVYCLWKAFRPAGNANMLNESSVSPK